MAILLLAIIYAAAVSLGLPDALLGAAWPIMFEEFSVPVSFAGIISAIISCGTVTSSLLSDRMTRRFGAGVVTAVSVAMTALALFGFSSCKAFWMLILWAIPYGLGAGGIDSALNNYVALHYESRHMSWFHCMWGVGAATGPYVMGYALSGGMGWPTGYRIIGVLQIVLTVIIVLSLPIWKKRTAQTEEKSKALPLREIFRIPGAKEVLLAFFCYCAIESTAGLWASSYLVLYKGVPSERAASFASMFFIGITVGRAFNGFLTYKFSDTQLIRAGQATITLGTLALLLPLGEAVALGGLILIGVGCAPIYPCIIHSTPSHFGAENSQAIIGVQMACAYTGSLLMPPLFGRIASGISMALFPVFLLALLMLMVLMHERLVKKVPA